jgi:hypothetical protein
MLDSALQKVCGVCARLTLLQGLQLWMLRAAVAPLASPCVSPAGERRALGCHMHTTTQVAGELSGGSCCAGCGRVIGLGTSLTALGKLWHPACFTCALLAAA